MTFTLGFLCGLCGGIFLTILMLILAGKDMERWINADFDEE